MTAWLDDLRGVVGKRLSVSVSDRGQHGRDPGHPDGAAPDAVAYAMTTDEVAALVTVCARHGRPVIPYGVGSSLEGQVSAPHGGLSLNLSRMTRVLSVNAADMDVLSPPVPSRQSEASFRCSSIMASPTLTIFIAGGEPPLSSGPSWRPSAVTIRKTSGYRLQP